MPTARPSISASVGALLATVVSDDTRMIVLIVTPTPTSDVRIGIPAASSERKVTTRIRKEMNSPITSGILLGSEVVL